MINVTDIAEYLYCPRKVYIKKVKNIKEPFNRAMLIGTLKHKILDTFNKDEEKMILNIANKISEKEITELYTNLLIKKINEVIRENDPRLKAFNINKDELSREIIEESADFISVKSKICHKFLNLGFFGSSLLENINPKFQTELEIESPLIKIRGRIDRVEFNNDLIIPYEIKNKEEIFDSDILQLSTYAILLESGFCRKVTKGIIETKKEKHEFIIDEKLKNKVFEIRDKILSLIAKDVPPPIQSNFRKCESCFFKKVCVEL